MTTPVIEVQALSKCYDQVWAVEDVSFTIERGATCALLGANGAGKTTTLAMLLGLVLPTSGQIRVLGEDLLAHRYRILPRINFSSPYVDLPQRLTVTENLTVYGRLYGVRDIRERIVQMGKHLDIAHLMKREYGTLSAGQKTRVSLAKAFLNRPEVILLDEPTASLDPDIADRIRSYFMAYQRDSGATLVLASHNMTEVERISTDVIIMRTGRIVDRGRAAALVAKYGRSSMEEVFLDIARNSQERSEQPLRKRAV